MNTVVYSANLLTTFSGTLIALAVVLGIGVFALIFAVFNGREKKLTRIIMAVLGLFLCAVGALALGYTALSVLTGAKTVTVTVNTRRIAEDNCGDNGDTCKRYVLETSAGMHSYDFTVEPRAFVSTIKGGCYRVTYYPSTGLFASDPDTSLYVANDHVSQIEQMQASDCK